MSAKSEAEWCVVCMRRTHLCSCPKSPELRCAPDGADRRVLAAMSAIPTAKLQSWIARGFASVLELAKAELARRGEPEVAGPKVPAPPQVIDLFQALADSLKKGPAR